MQFVKFTPSILTIPSKIVNTLRLRRIAAIAEDIFKCIFFKENAWILIETSLKFVLEDPIGIKSALLQMMAWCHTDDKPLSEPMIAQLTDAYM